MTDKILAGGGDDYLAIRELNPGERIYLKGNIIAEVIDNPRDGMWIIVRVTGGEPEMVMADEVIGRA